MVLDGLRTSLAPDVLFDLLADPQGCVTWHEHPKGFVIESVDSPPGAALAGTRFTTIGRIGDIPFTSETVVTDAVRPFWYAMRSETRIQHPRALLLSTVGAQSYAIEPEGDGSAVGYKTECFRTWRSGLVSMYAQLVQAVFDRRKATVATRSHQELLLRSAERHAAPRA